MANDSQILSVACLTPTESGINIQNKSITLEVDEDMIEIPLFDDKGSQVYEKYLKKLVSEEEREDSEHGYNIER